MVCFSPNLRASAAALEADVDTADAADTCLGVGLPFQLLAH